MAKRRSRDEEETAAWAGGALLDGAELARRRAAAGSPAARAALARLGFERTVLEMAGEVGYEAVTVEGLVARSGSNRARFYAAFAGKAECFAEAYATAAEALAARLLGACEGAGDWAAGMRAALRQLAAFLEAEPGLAAGVFLGPVGAGAAVAAKRREVFGRLTHAVDRARRETTGSRHAPPPFTAAFILWGIEAAVIRSLAEPGPGGFDAELPGLLGLAVDYYLGPEAAREAVRGLRAPG